MTGPDGEPAVPARELLQAQERAIGALEELNRVRQAYEASERARNQSLQVATVLFALLGQTQAQVAGLSRRLESLQAAPDVLSVDIESIHMRLMRATTQEGDLRVQLNRAESERERAQAVADLAARRIQALESELRKYRGVDNSTVTGATGAIALPQQSTGPTDEDGELDHVDATLRKVREVLDREHRTVAEIASELRADDAPRGDTDTVPSERPLPVNVPGSGPADLDEELFETIPHNAERTATSLVPRRDDDRMRFVGAATRRISRGIDPDEIVQGLCRATVPTFADAILVHLRHPLPVGDERPVSPFVLRLRQRYATLDVTRSGGTTAVDLTRCTAVSEVRSSGALSEVLRRVRPVFGDSAEASAALHELLGENFESPQTGRVILAPLRGRHRIIGTAVFLRRPDRRPFEPGDLLAAAQLTAQTALGIDKAILYGREAYIADELQRIMLPEGLPPAAGVRLASRYLPASETARVGSDWYDAVPLPGSRVALVVGDVMGHSMASATIMGQFRTTVLTLAGLDLSPQEVLRHLDEQAQRLGHDHMATCMYAVYDPITHRVVLANAGHPPPILLHPDGRAEVLHIPPGPPIGVGGPEFQTVELAAPAGATLLLYTNGLVESRLQDVWAGIEQLRGRLAATAQRTGPGLPPPLEALCDDALEMLGPGSRDDDIALLAAHFEGLTTSDVPGGAPAEEAPAPGP
ncbi:PP2C family protein-serine/threonine phosphatase [Streptomyces inusitatus]|uniref:PP2C family protein-serine/threonine phosphatase n=1 Tax=Streptomyces inusitatus TaxID=68221 RepID=UPI001E5AB76B|nr:SpoIIE family protein phosphatase [Streptomyces inusitatus]